MNRSQYRKARSLIRANGQAAMRCIDPSHIHAIEQLVAIQNTADLLAWRANWSRRNDCPVVRLLLTTPFQSVLSHFAP